MKTKELVSAIAVMAMSVSALAGMETVSSADETTTTATLEHTAHVAAGKSVDYGQAVDAEAEFYQYDKVGNYSSGWAFADFSFDIPEGAEITGATLTWANNQYGTKSRDTTIYYLNAGNRPNYTAIAEATEDASNAQFDGSKTAIGTVSTAAGDNTNITTDVTAAVKAMAEQEYIVFQWTGNKAAAHIYGKASSYAPTLTITTGEGTLVPAVEWETAVDSIKTGEGDKARGTLRFLASVSDNNGYDISKGEYGFVFVNFDPDVVTKDYMGETEIPVFTGETDKNTKSAVESVAQNGLQKNKAYFVDIEDIPLSVSKIGVYAVPYITLEDGFVIYGPPFTAKKFNWVSE